MRQRHPSEESTSSGNPFVCLSRRLHPRCFVMAFLAITKGCMPARACFNPKRTGGRQVSVHQAVKVSSVSISFRSGGEGGGTARGSQGLCDFLQPYVSCVPGALMVRQATAAYALACFMHSMVVGAIQGSYGKCTSMEVSCKLRFLKDYRSCVFV